MDLLEQRLIKQAKAGDRQAFSEIVELYKNKVYQVAFRMLGNRSEAEDIAQETFLRVYSKLSYYDPKHKFSTWIYRITTNLCIDRLRKKKASYSLDQDIPGTDGLDMYSQLASQDQSPEEEVMRMELQNEVQNAIDKLPIQYKTIMVLRYIEDLSLQEVSKVVDLPITTIKTRIHRGREAMKKLLRKF